MASPSQLKRPHGLVAAAVVAALCLQALLRTPDIADESSRRRRSLGAVPSHTRKLARKLAEEAEEAHAFERFLLQHVSTTSLEEAEYAEFASPEEGGGYDAAAEAGFRDEARSPTETERQSSHALPDVARYDLRDALAESGAWEIAFSVLIYDPEKDVFVAYVNRGHQWNPANNKLFRALRGLAYLLRTEFPDRFCGAGCDELAIPVGSGDYPHVKQKRLPHEGGRAPTLMFGSAFRDPGLYPKMIAMPMPSELHLDCFVEWAANGGARVCSKLTSSGDQLVFGDDLGLEWEDLTPQVTSRVSDFAYLPTLQEHILGKLGLGYHRAESRPLPSQIFEGGEAGASKEAVVQALEEAYDELVPRWKGAALTARAEIDATAAGDQGDGPSLPWANLKLSFFNKGGTRVATLGAEGYRLWEAAGVAVGDFMGSSKLATYRYQIDLAGGGGTTWTGTVEKLAMPGLLFHHVSPTKDYIHDRLKPWKHYIPVRPDLKDLKAKFDWAEAHQTEAKRIADAGTAFMRDLGSPEGFGRMYQEDVAGPLRRVVEAYRPMSETHPEMSSWRELFDSIEGNPEVAVAECPGRSRYGKCRFVKSEAVEYWRNHGVYQAGLASA